MDFKNKNYIKAILDVLEAAKSQRYIEEGKGIELVGDYWVVVLQQLQADGIARPRTYGEFELLRQSLIPSAIIMYSDELKKLEDEDKSKELEEKVKNLTVENLDFQNKEARYQDELRVYRTLTFALTIVSTIFGTLSAILALL